VPGFPRELPQERDLADECFFDVFLVPLVRRPGPAPAFEAWRRGDRAARTEPPPASPNRVLTGLDRYLTIDDPQSLTIDVPTLG